MQFKSNTISIVISGLAFISALTITGCKKDCLDPANPDCSNYDACLTATQTNADFGFFNKGYLSSNGESVEIYLPTRDTVFILEGGPYFMYFRANSSEMDHYEWQIGLDPRTFNDSIHRTTFQNVAGDIDVTLKVAQESPNTDCFPDDTGLDQVTRTVHFVPYTASTIEEELAYRPIYGEYLGYNEDTPSDTFRVKINRTHWPTGFPNITGLFEDFTVWDFTGNSHYIYFIEERTEYNTEGSIELLPGNKTIVIDYVIKHHDGKVIPRKWVGEKI
ncbi:MAG: hypothetical protein GVY26_20780 [Bacteroidetes bacterium]|nr:hypothetical protein [Bacteroidota bacterium]